jgi:hypothetical protein
MDLRSLRINAADELDDLLKGFDPQGDREALLSLYNLLSHDFFTIAVTTLLLDGETQFFHLNLVRAAENGFRILCLFRQRGLELPPASHDVPLRAALAAGDFARANALSAISRDTHAETELEYEDEFLWARVLQVLAQTKPAPAHVEPLLERLEAANSEVYAGRVASVRALLARDAEGFNKAFVIAQLIHEAEVEERAASFATPEREFAPHRFIWLEGLALLNLAARGGLRYQGESRYCPYLARLPMTATYHGDWVIHVGDAT